MADHNKPTATSTYPDFVTELKGRFDDVVKGLDPEKTSPTNLPANAIRWTSASNKWERWDGVAWGDLSDGYAISITGSAASLATARTISLFGAVTGTATSFDGSTDITIPVTEIDPTALLGPVPVDKGGTGATSASAARSSLGAAATSITITAGDGLTGGGSLSANRTIALGTPSTINGSSGNTASATTHTHALNVVASDVSGFQNAVSSSMGAITADQIGSTVMASCVVSGALNIDANVAGSNLRPCDAAGVVQPDTTLPGSWKLCAYKPSGTNKVVVVRRYV